MDARRKCGVRMAATRVRIKRCLILNTGHVHFSDLRHIAMVADPSRACRGIPGFAPIRDPSDR